MRIWRFHFKNIKSSYSLDSPFSIFINQIF